MTEPPAGCIMFSGRRASAADACGQPKGLMMDEKKRERLMKVFRVVALILAVLMVGGIIFQAFVY